MSGRRVRYTFDSTNERRRPADCAVRLAVLIVVATIAQSSAAQKSPPAELARPAAEVAPARAPAAAAPAKTQAELEAALSKLLSGATLEGSYTSTAGGRAPGELKNDKYTLGDVRKLEGNIWLIQTKIQYRGGDPVMLPLPLPIEWAGDTPVIVVNNVSIPGFGTFSARVMFFDDHYVGYWKHSGDEEHGGHLFGLIRPAGTAANGREGEAPAER